MIANNGAAPGQESGPAKTPSSPQATESTPKLPDHGTMLDAANDVLRRGWKPVQLHHITAGGTCSCGNSACRSAGKHPVGTGWQQLPMSGADVWTIWNPDDGIDLQANVGVQTGWASGGLLVIDIDRPSALDELVERCGPEITDTYTVQTGSGGQHLYFQLPEDVALGNTVGKLAGGVDTRGDNGQVLTVGSTTAKGTYRLLQDSPVRPIPAPLLQALQALQRVDVPDITVAVAPRTTPPTPAEVRYVTSAIELELARLDRLQEQSRLDWKRGDPGDPWDQTCFEVCCNVIELANTQAGPSLADVKVEILKRMPTDNRWTKGSTEAKWQHAYERKRGAARRLPDSVLRPAATVYPGDPLTDPSARVLPAAPAETPAQQPAGDEVIRRAWSDLGNARRMVDLYSDRLHWITEAREWAEYEDGVWEIRGDAGLTAAQTMVEGLPGSEEALGYDDEPGGDDPDKPQPSEREKFLKWARSQQMSARINAAVQQSTGRPEFKVSRTDFDLDEDLLNCGNGVVDLRTGELLHHAPRRLMMQQAAVTYDPTAACPRWLAFLERVQPNPEVRDYLQRVVGYSLTGSITEQVIFIHQGDGANGKSVFLIVLAHLLGNYAQGMPPTSLLAKRNAETTIPNDVARMAGARLLTATETSAGKYLDDEAVKRFTGGEQVTARFMRGEFFDFTPTGKIHLATNHPPLLDSGGAAIARRLRYIGWDVVIPEEEQDPSMLQAASWREEMPGIFAWAVRGCLAWRRHGLSAPDAVRANTAARVAEADPLAPFLEERVICNAGATEFIHLYEAYETWCGRNGVKRPLSGKAFSTALEARGFTKWKHAHHRRVMFSLQLRPAVVPSRSTAAASEG